LHLFKSESRRQKAEGEKGVRAGDAAMTPHVILSAAKDLRMRSSGHIENLHFSSFFLVFFLRSAFCLLPSAFCLLPLSQY
jgi:hypothetical protein